MGQEPQWSADGQWWWNGHQWVPAAQAAAEDALPTRTTVTAPPQPPAAYYPTAQVTAPIGPPAVVPKKGHLFRNLGIGLVVLIVVGVCVGQLGKVGTSNQMPLANTNTSSSQTGSSPTPPSSPSPVVPHTVLVVSGTGYETTQPFKIPSPEWTLGWTVTGDPQYAQISFEIYNSSGDHVDSVDAGPGADSATEHQGKDMFFIDILVANAAYKLTITASYAGPDQTFTLPPMTKVTAVNGSGDKSSPTFHIGGSIWRIDVHSASVNQYTTVTAYVESASDSSKVSEASVEGAQGGRDTTSYVYVGSGDYYIKVLSANTTWTVTIEQTSS